MTVLRQKTKKVTKFPLIRADTGDLTALMAIMRRLSVAHSLSEIMEVVTQAARILIGADGITFVLRDLDRCYYAEEDAISPLWKGKRFPMSACISGWCMIERKPAVIGNIYEDPRIPQDAYRPTFVRSLAMVPVRQEDPIAAIGAYWSTVRVISPIELDLLQSVANSAALALAKIELEQERERVRIANAEIVAMNEKLQQVLAREQLNARTDDLTGLCNRRHFFELSERLLTAAQRYHTPLSVVLFDIDHFKRVNDMFGHQVGDEVVKRVAQLAREHTQNANILARYGGEEFIMTLPNSSVHEALAAAENIRERIAACRELVEDKEVNATISAGVAQILPGENTMDRLIQRADQALYAAKNAGRNRSMIFSSGLRTGNCQVNCVAAR